MKLIGITGMPGSGKSAIIEVSKKYNIPVVSMGDVVRHETIKRGLELNPDNVGNTAVELRKKYGNEAVAVPCLQYIEEHYGDNNVVIIEGIRSMYEVNYFRKYYPLKIIAIHSSPKTRFKRLKSRNREDDTSEWEKFVERDLRELKFSIGSVIALSDYMVINEGSYRKYLNNLEDTLKVAMMHD
jgi:dephospho-CoA kinase